jgi:hypothetical protein
MRSPGQERPVLIDGDCIGWVDPTLGTRELDDALRRLATPQPRSILDVPVAVNTPAIGKVAAEPGPLAGLILGLGAVMSLTTRRARRHRTLRIRIWPASRLLRDAAARLPLPDPFRLWRA